MAKRLHPKTIEERIHQILCMDQDPEQENVTNSKKCNLQLHTSKPSSSRTLPNIKYLPYFNSQRSSIANGYQRNNYRTNDQTSQQQQPIKSYVCSNM